MLMEFQNLRRLQTKAEVVLHGPEHFCSLFWVSPKCEKYFLIIPIYLSNWQRTGNIFSMSEYVSDSKGVCKNGLITYFISYLPKIVQLNSMEALIN